MPKIPAAMMKIEITHAKMGRSIKNLAIDAFLIPLQKQVWLQMPSERRIEARQLGFQTASIL